MCIVDKKSDDVSKSLELNNLRKALPPSVFEKSLIKSLFYLFIDLSMCLASFYAIWTLCHSVSWSELPSWQKGVATIVYWNICGFFMWGLFVVGHDCGHGTFSNYEWLNDALGHLIHGAIMVPYWPWQMSHRRHHMYHNHAEKDYSHPWHTDEYLKRPETYVARWVDQNAWFRILFPIIGWQLYLYGLPDGNHFIPWPQQRMWKESESIEYVKCIVSSFVVVVYAVLFCHLFQYNAGDIAYYYVAPLITFGWWLTTVTYLQHHSPDTLAYDDSNWSFVNAAFETVDRTYGFGIDDLHHNISDGHVVHHLFFTKIPHYHLKTATIALRKYMQEQGFASLYRHENTYDFALRIFVYFGNFGHRAHLKADSTAVPKPTGVNASKAGSSKKRS